MKPRKTFYFMYGFSLAIKKPYGILIIGSFIINLQNILEMLLIPCWISNPVQTAKKPSTLGFTFIKVLPIKSVYEIVEGRHLVHLFRANLLTLTVNTIPFLRFKQRFACLFIEQDTGSIQN